MEVSVVYCHKIKPTFDHFYDLSFSFPNEWETEECIWLTGMWLSHEEAVSWVQLRYHGLYIIDSSPLRIGDDMNWLSKFDFPIVILKQGSGHSFCITADKEIGDFAVTFEWRSSSYSSIGDDEILTYTSFSESYLWADGERASGHEKVKQNSSKCARRKRTTRPFRYGQSKI